MSVLTSKELRLDRGAPHPTRVDLLGNSESTGLTIIELMKSDQTERQAFTELLAYSNYFGSIFPPENGPRRDHCARRMNNTL